MLIILSLIFIVIIPLGSTLQSVDDAIIVINQTAATVNQTSARINQIIDQINRLEDRLLAFEENICNNKQFVCTTLNRIFGINFDTCIATLDAVCPAPPDQP